MTDPFAAGLAAAVRARRDALRLSQQDLADMAGVSERLVRFVEQGKPTLRLDTLLAVLETLGLELNLGIRARNAAQTLASQPPSDIPPSAQPPSDIPGNEPGPENRP